MRDWCVAKMHIIAKSTYISNGRCLNSQLFRIHTSDFVLLNTVNIITISCELPDLFELV